MTVSLGMPSTPPAPLAPRRKTRQIKVGSVAVGSDAPVSVQSMTTTLTADVNATLQQIAELTAAGCDIVRVACPSPGRRRALPEIAKQVQIPVIADIHFQPQVRVRRDRRRLRGGAGQPGQHPGSSTTRSARSPGPPRTPATPIRIGVNAGSLDKRLLAKYGKATPEALVESALWEARCSRSTTSATSRSRSSTTTRCHGAGLRAARRAVRLPAAPRRHRGRPGVPGHHQVFGRRSGRCSPEGIGDTIRVSLSAPPVEEVKVGLPILESLNLRQRGLEIVSCPSCGRAQVDVYTLADEVTAASRASRCRCGWRSWAAS